MEGLPPEEHWLELELATVFEDPASCLRCPIGLGGSPDVYFMWSGVWISMFFREVCEGWPVSVRCRILSILNSYFYAILVTVWMASCSWWLACVDRVCSCCLSCPISLPLSCSVYCEEGRLFIVDSLGRSLCCMLSR